MIRICISTVFSAYLSYIVNKSNMSALVSFKSTKTEVRHDKKNKKKYTTRRDWSDFGEIIFGGNIDQSNTTHITLYNYM